VSETVTEEACGFKNLVTLIIKTDKGEERVSGTVFFRGRSRIVAVGCYTMDLIPEGHVLVSRHMDQPGVIGRAATILGKNNINIAGMQVGRFNPKEPALMVLNVDSDVPQPVIDEMRSLPGIFSMTFARISDEKI
jgi:D-3-phosphoglycerate dehydrogenase